MQESNQSHFLYAGHSIFRNQPPHTYFNKSFADKTDALFLSLNEIHPFYLAEGRLDDDAAFRNEVICDPRTKQQVETFSYNHTQAHKPKIFSSAVKSKLTKAQHVVCLRVLHAWQQQKPVNEADLLMWRQMQQPREAEKQEMQKYIYEFEQSNKEQIYAPTRRLVELYRRYYSRKLEMVLWQYPQEVSFNTHSGLPHVRVCRGSNPDRRMEVANVELLKRRGYVQLLANDDSTKPRHMHCSLSTHTAYYLDALPQKERLVKEIKRHLNPHSMGMDGERPSFYMPLESLLFLCTAGEYTDLPTEVLLRISESPDGQTKHIDFETPLPARNCGWHTHKVVVEHAYSAYIAALDSTRWLRLEDDVVHVEANEDTREIDGRLSEHVKFAPVPFEEYMLKYSKIDDKPERHLKHNAALLRWRLKAVDCDEGLDMFTCLELPPALDEGADRHLGHQTLKLENKSQFGCEIMTKYELLHAWFQMTLLNGCTAIDAGRCLRVSTEDLRTQLEERLTLPQIEEQLSRIYHIQMPQLLANMAEFLALLLNMPPAEYMLRYNPKFKDQLMLSVPSQEVTKNTVFLHKLLNVEPSDMLFMTQPNFLPLADNLCSVMHLHHKVLPCAFTPLLKHQQPAAAPGKSKQKPLNDLDYIAKCIKKKEDLKNAKKQHFEKFNKTRQKARKRKRTKLKRAAIKLKSLEDDEAQKDIDADKILFGY